MEKTAEKWRKKTKISAIYSLFLILRISEIHFFLLFFLADSKKNRNIAV